MDMDQEKPRISRVQPHSNLDFRWPGWEHISKKVYQDLGRHQNPTKKKQSAASRVEFHAPPAKKKMRIGYYSLD
mgnify:CR=1 FL=1